MTRHTGPAGPARNRKDDLIVPSYQQRAAHIRTHVSGLAATARRTDRSIRRLVAIRRLANLSTGICIAAVALSVACCRGTPDPFGYAAAVAVSLAVEILSHVAACRADAARGELAAVLAGIKKDLAAAKSALNTLDAAIAGDRAPYDWAKDGCLRPETQERK